MLQGSIRLARTPDVNTVISYLTTRYPLLSEAEVLKLALSEKYQKERHQAENEELPSDYLLRSLKKAQEQLEKGETSPTFDNADDLIEYLHKK